MANLINIGVTGLIAHQSAISTTGNNITNANVAGYSRQRVELNPLPEQYMGSGYLGSGVNVTGVERIVEQLLINQLRLDTANFNSVDIRASMFEQLDSLLADSSTGIAPMMQQLFASVQQAAQDPTSLPVRQVLLNDAGSLAQRFNSLHAMLQGQQTVLNQQLDALTGQVNSLAAGVAKLNQQIAESSNSNGAAPNALMDKRDEMVRQLSELVGVKVVPDGSGQFNVFIGNGQSLVVGNRANQISTAPSAEDSSQREIIFSTGTVQAPITQYLGGGKIGGLLEYRNQGLEPAMNELGRIAITLADAFNRQQQMGLDLDGNPGSALFHDINTPAAMAGRVLASGNNEGSAQIEVHIGNSGALSGGDYRLQFSSASDYQLVDANGRALTPPVAGSLGALPATITTPDGFELRIGSGSSFSAGDLFRIQPTRQGAREVGVALASPRELAFAQPVSTGAAIANVGTGAISAGAMLAPLPAAGAPVPPLLVRFTGANAYEILDNSDPAAPVPFAPPVGGTITPGQTNTITINDPVGGTGNPVYRFELSGHPASGDSFSIAFNANGSSDNRNAVAMGELRLGKLMGGNQTLDSAYNAMVATVGATTAALQINRESAESLLAQAQANRDAVSGVNLDEEAANLIRFEQAYNASAQVISIARSLFDSLIAAVR